MSTEPISCDPSPAGGLETFTHAALIEQSAKWLSRQGCAVVITDMTHGGPETADAIGWRGRFSTLIECKVSLADFRADAKKLFRRDPSRGMGCQRYYCTPRGLLKLDMLPERWGLLEWDGKQMCVLRKAEMQRHEEGTREEIQLLISAMRRLAGERPKGVSVRCYKLETKSRATLGIRTPEQQAGAQASVPGERHHECFKMECEAYVVHRDDCFVKAQGDPASLPWRACVRTGDGTLHWEWCRTERKALEWIERWKGSPNKAAAGPLE